MISNKVKILTMEVSATCSSDVIKNILYLINKKKPSYICLSNVHMCMETYDAASFRDIVNSASLVVADGRPIYWAQKLLGYKEVEQIRGQELMNQLCGLSHSHQLNIGLYGGSSDKALKEITGKLESQFPNINITYQFSPPFRPLTKDENTQVIETIANANVDILFVGIGCPKQEIWMAANYKNLPCVMIGVGAAFDFISGEKKHAPLWMQKMGFEWVFRVLSEPIRLTPRYFKSNPRFLYHFVKQLIKQKK